MATEIVVGIPGGGKTTTLLNIVEDELASGTPPDRIGYISFTKRAAEEAIGRASTRFKLARKAFPYFRTIHSLCFQALGIKSADVLQGHRLEEFGDVVGCKITGRFSLDDGTFTGFEKGDRLLFMENLARVRRIPLRQLYDEDGDQLSFHELERFAGALAAYKSDLGILDFTDMLQQFVDSGSTVKLDVLLVDECQDLSLLQWDVVLKLASGARRFVVAGDDDQAIYRWAGADVERLVDLQGSVKELTQSWRVPVTVQAIANQIVSRIRHRREKVWLPRKEQGLVQFHANESSVDLSGPDILVLARNRYLLREFERVIRSAGYLYDMQGTRSIRTALLDAVLTWERLRQGRAGVTGADCRKMYEQMSVGTSVTRGFKMLPDFEDTDEVNMDALRDRGGLLVDPEKFWFDALDRLPMTDVAYLRAARRRGENLTAPPRIRLSTIHGMKGGEGRQVVLLTDMAARTAAEAVKAPDDEQRVWYVAVTRAREELHIVAPKTTRNYSF